MKKYYLILFSFFFYYTIQAQQQSVGTVDQLIQLMSTAGKGESNSVKIEVPEHPDAMIHFNLIDGVTFAGSISSSKHGSFNLRKEKNGLFGHAIFYDESKAYEYYTNETGHVLAKRVNIHDVVCINYQKDNAPIQYEKGQEIQAQPNLQSLPGAQAVVYIDMDGEVSTSSWNNGQTVNAQPVGYSNAQMRQIWEYVVEDMAPFDVNVTTIRSVFDAAPRNRRMMAIITTTNWRGSGGVAYLNSFTRNDDPPCWVFNTGIQAAATTVSHEVGHTFGLSHDGRTSPSEEYYRGHGSWGPIMGAAFGKSFDQWSKGEYANSSQRQDDLSIITSRNGFGYRNDDVGNNSQNAKELVVSQQGDIGENIGLIERTNDRDWFEFTMNGGVVDIKVDNAVRTNLDIVANIVDANGNTVLSGDNGGLDSDLDGTLQAGTYYLVIDGGGTGNPTTGWSDYGSLGFYSISGKIPPSNIDCNGVEDGTAYIDDCDICVGGNTGKAPCLVPEISSSEPKLFCEGESITLTAEGGPGTTGNVSFQWFLNGQPIQGAIASTYEASESGTYSVEAEEGPSSGVSNEITITVVGKPDAPTLSAQPLCGGGEAVITANSKGGTIFWYSDENSSQSIASGNELSVNINQTTTYYAEENTEKPLRYIGPESNILGTGGNHNGGFYLVFDALEDLTIKTAKVYAEGTKDREIILLDGEGNEVVTKTINITDGESVIELDFFVPAGTEYQLGVAQGADLFRNDDVTAINYPFVLDGLMSINRSTATSDPLGYYYYFYNIEIKEDYPACVGERGSIEVVVNEIPEVPNTGATENCGQVTLSASGSGVGEIKWYADESTTSFLGAGEELEQEITGPTTFYVREEIASTPIKVGASDNTIGNGGFHTGGFYLVMDVEQEFVLKSAIVYADGIKDRTFELQDSEGNIIESKTVNVPDGESRVQLDFVVPVGEGLRIGASSGADLFRNNSGVSFPYELNGVVSITRSSATSDPFEFYYYLYDWEIIPSNGICAGELGEIDVELGVCLSINDEVLNNNIVIYPNPTRDVIYLIENDEPLQEKWILINAQGNQISKGETSVIDMNQLVRGVYFVEIITPEGTIRKKVTKQ